MKLHKVLFLALLGILTISSCKKDDDINNDVRGNETTQQTSLPENVAQISENIYSYVGAGQYYSMFIVTTEGVIAIESVSTTHSENMLKAIKEVTDQPVKYLLHSHDHWDHASGGQVFKDAGAKTMAHKEAFEAMTANTGPDMAVPDESWEGCQKSITLGETTVELHYLGVNHGQGMTVFLVPNQKVAYIADLVTPNRVLFSIVPDFNITEWERSLEEIIAMDFEKAVYSHNESPTALNGGVKQDAVINLQIIRDIRAGIFAELANGTPFGMLTSVLKLPQYENFVGYDEWLPFNIQSVILDIIMGPNPSTRPVDACVMGLDPVAPSAASTTTPEGEAVEIADGVYSYGTGNGNFSMFVVTTDGVVAIESFNTEHSLGMLAAIKSVTSLPVKYLLHSHDHWDHSSGGQVFKDAGAKTMAHKEAFDAMSARPGPDMAVPDESWEGCTNSLTLGGTTIKMEYLGINHGLGMTVFIVGDQKVAYVADLVTPNRMLFTIVPDFNIREWERSLKTINEMDFNKAVYSHNPSADAKNGGTKQDAVVNLQLIKDIREGINAEFQKGTPAGEIPTTVQLPKYKDFVGYDSWLTMNVWRIFLDMGMGPYPWRANVDNCGA